MTALTEILRRRIGTDGPITVAEFMATALQHAEHGYYRKARPIGAAGDFITAPEISQMFGEMIGLWCVDTWRDLGRPAPFALVELGPGRGTLLVDALRAARVEPAFARALTLHLVETNAALRATQSERLGRFAPQWHETLAGVPALPLIAIANEFFDALAIHQLERMAGGFRERRIAYAGPQRRFTFVTGPLDPAAQAALAGDPRRDAPEGAIIEICPEGLAVCRQLGARIAGAGGAALIIDYGPAESMTGDSLQAMRRHRPHPVLENPGDADLTAHVDFSALARTAKAAGIAAHGPLPQGLWLRRLGIEARARRLRAGATPAQAHEIQSSLHRLVSPEAMGTLFKVLALGPRGGRPPAGFESVDLDPTGFAPSRADADRALC